MKTAIFKIKSLSPLTFGKYHQTEKLNKELPDAYEQRTWREKAHVNKQGHVIIPGVMVANCLRESAKFMSIQVPGKGKSTYTKHFDAGIVPIDDIVLTIKKEDLKVHAQHVPSDGRPGGTRRVIRLYPIIHEWEGSLTFKVGDDIITADIFEQVLRNAGTLIGLGTWRPRNRGMNGRFDVIDLKWIE